MLIAILCIFIEISYASTPKSHSCSNDRRESCKSLDLLHEIGKVAKNSHAKHSMLAKYCLHFNAQKDSIWELILYEKAASLSEKIQKKCDSYSFSGKIDLEPSKIFSSNFGVESGFCIKTCTGSKEACEKRGNECEVDISEKYNIRDYKDGFSINSCLKNMEQISHLFNMYLPMKWDLQISCENEKIPISGSDYIYISEICTEEQLKKKEEYDKYGEKR